MKAFEEAAEAYLAEGAVNAAGVRSALVGASQRTLEASTAGQSPAEREARRSSRADARPPRELAGRTPTFMAGEVEQEFLRAVVMHGSLQPAFCARRSRAGIDHYLLATSQWWTPASTRPLSGV